MFIGMMKIVKTLLFGSTNYNTFSLYIHGGRIGGTSAMRIFLMIHLATNAVPAARFSAR